MTVDKEHLYEAIPCGCVSFRTDGKIVSINQTLLSWLDMQEADVVDQKRFSDLLSVGGKLYYQMVLLPQLFREGEVNEINFDIKVNDYSMFPSLCNAVVTTPPGSDQQIVIASILKINDRKKLEAELKKEKRIAEEQNKRFETMANVIPNIIFTALPNGEPNFANKRFFEELNIAPSDLSTTSLLAICHPDEKEHLREKWKHAVQHKDNMDAEVRMLVRNNEYCWYLLRAVPYLDSVGNVLQWFGSCTDIHEHKEKERQMLENLNASLTEASEIINQHVQTLDEISYYQSHQVRKPLANILALINIMADDANAAEIKDTFLPMLLHSAEELDRVVKSIVG